MEREISLVKMKMGAGFLLISKERSDPLMSLLLACGDIFKLKKQMNTRGSVR